MPLSAADRTAIRESELRLLNPATRRDSAAVAALLTEEFEEIGPRP